MTTMTKRQGFYQMRAALLAQGFKMTAYEPRGTTGFNWQHFQHADGRQARIQRTESGRYTVAQDV